MSGPQLWERVLTVLVGVLLVAAYATERRRRRLSRVFLVMAWLALVAGVATSIAARLS